MIQTSSSLFNQSTENNSNQESDKLPNKQMK
jgi:hypothetical protein